MTDESRAIIDQATEELGVDFSPAPTDLDAYRLLRQPRVGIYQGFVPIADEGWTRWLLDQYEFDYDSVDNARIQAGRLNDTYDVLILPDTSPSTLHGGYVEGAIYDGAQIPPAYSGGIGDRGAAAIRSFVRSGGTLVAFNDASSYAIDRLGAPVENVLGEVSSDTFYSPGSLLNVDIEASHPLCFGMRPREALWFESGPAFRPSRPGDSNVRVVARYPNTDVLASGWLAGEQQIASRPAVVDIESGDGHFVLFGIRPQYRGQSNAAFKMVFNSLFYWDHQ
jgi:hypothetical protein